MRRKTIGIAAAALMLALGDSAGTQAQQPMSFFITGVNPGKGADLGGLVGADAYCQALARAVNAGNLTWRAYLSTSATKTAPAVNARDRSGRQVVQCEGCDDCGQSQRAAQESEHQC